MDPALEEKITNYSISLKNHFNAQESADFANHNEAQSIMRSAWEINYQEAQILEGLGLEKSETAPETINNIIQATQEAGSSAADGLKEFAEVLTP